MKERQTGRPCELRLRISLKGNMHWLVEWYEKQLPEIGVDVRLNTEATVSNVKAVNPDAVIIATGAKPIISRGIAGTDAENVFGIFDVLDGKSGLENKNVIIAGAGITGLECASYLNAKGCKTTIIDQLTAVAPNDNHNIVADDCSRLKAAGTEFAMGLSSRRSARTASRLRTQRARRKCFL